MDKASAYGAGDCRFESCRGHVPPASSTFWISFHRRKCKTFRSLGGRKSLASRSCRVVLAGARWNHLRSICCFARVISLAKRPASTTETEPRAPSSRWGGALAPRRSMRPPLSDTFNCALLSFPRRAGLQWAGARVTDRPAGLFEMRRGSPNSTGSRRIVLVALRCFMTLGGFGRGVLQPNSISFFLHTPQALLAEFCECRTSASEGGELSARLPQGWLSCAADGQSGPPHHGWA